MHNEGYLFGTVLMILVAVRILDMLFPALLSGDIALKEIKKYEVAASILTQRLGQ